MGTHDTLFDYISRYAATPLTSEEKDTIRQVFLPKKLRKKQYFLQEGVVCKYSGFIVKGAMRQYSVDEKGVEHVTGLFIENWWVTDLESFTMLTPSIYNIDAWEDTELLQISQADTLAYLNPIPAIQELSKQLTDNHTFALHKRLHSSITDSAEKRYEVLANAYPEFLQRFPQHVIASYLGVTKETLSRICSRAVRK